MFSSHVTSAGAPMGCYERKSFIARVFFSSSFHSNPWVPQLQPCGQNTICRFALTGQAGHLPSASPRLCASALKLYFKAWRQGSLRQRGFPPRLRLQRRRLAHAGQHLKEPDGKDLLDTLDKRGLLSHQVYQADPSYLALLAVRNNFV